MVWIHSKVSESQDCVFQQRYRTASRCKHYRYPWGGPFSREMARLSKVAGLSKAVGPWIWLQQISLLSQACMWSEMCTYALRCHHSRDWRLFSFYDALSIHIQVEVQTVHVLNRECLHVNHYSKHGTPAGHSATVPETR